MSNRTLHFCSEEAYSNVRSSALTTAQYMDRSVRETMVVVVSSSSHTAVSGQATRFQITHVPVPVCCSLEGRSSSAQLHCSLYTTSTIDLNTPDYSISVRQHTISIDDRSPVTVIVGSTKYAKLIRPWRLQLARTNHASMHGELLQSYYY